MRRLLYAVLLSPVLACAQPELADEDKPLRYLIGLELLAGPSAWGQSDMKLGAKPMAALHWGRLRISNSGASGLLGGGESGGASAELLKGRVWRLSAGLRIDRGRESSDSEVYAGLPDVPGTLRGRLSLSWRPDARHSMTLTWLPDLRDKGVGDHWNLSAGKSLDWTLWEARWAAYASLSGGDARYLRSHFGVPEAHFRYAPYAPGAGLRDLRVGLTMQRPVDERGRWVLFGQLSAGQLLGPAAASPFVRQRLGAGVALGIAYRR
jgi:outer membrane protein